MKKTKLIDIYALLLVGGIYGYSSVVGYRTYKWKSKITQYRPLRALKEMCWFRNARLLFSSQVRNNKTIPQGFEKYKTELTIRNKVLFYPQRLEILYVYSMFIYDAAVAAKHFNLFK